MRNNNVCKKCKWAGPIFSTKFPNLFCDLIMNHIHKDNIDEGTLETVFELGNEYERLEDCPPHDCPYLLEHTVSLQNDPKL